MVGFSRIKARGLIGRDFRSSRIIESRRTRQRAGQLVPGQVIEGSVRKARGNLSKGLTDQHGANDVLIVGPHGTDPIECGLGVSRE